MLYRHSALPSCVIDADVGGTGRQQRADVRAVADPTADRQRDIDLPCDRFDGMEQRRPIIHRRGDVEKPQLIRTLRVELAGDLDWIAGLLPVLALDAIAHATAVHIATRTQRKSLG